MSLLLREKPQEVALRHSKLRSRAIELCRTNHPSHRWDGSITRYTEELRLKHLYKVIKRYIRRQRAKTQVPEITLVLCFDCGVAFSKTALPVMFLPHASHHLEYLHMAEIPCDAYGHEASGFCPLCEAIWKRMHAQTLIHLRWQIMCWLHEWDRQPVKPLLRHVRRNNGGLRYETQAKALSKDVGRFSEGTVRRMRQEIHAVSGGVS